MATCLVDSGKVVPSLHISEDGIARSRWEPLPGASDRSTIASLLRADEIDEHRRVAMELAEEVDHLIRVRLAGEGLMLIPSRSGRRSVPQAWLESLTRADGALPASLPVDKVRAFATLLQEWEASGVVSIGQGTLGLRVHEPTTADAEWWLEPFWQDTDEPSLVVSLDELWAGRAPFPVASVAEVLRSLAQAVSIAPEITQVLDWPVPGGSALSTDQLVEFVDHRVQPLAEIGVTVLLPTWWTARRRVTLRAKASSKGPVGVVTDGGLNFDELVSFTWEAALGDRRLTKVDLRKLEQAAAAKQALVQVRGEWVQLDGSDLRRVVERVGSLGTVATGALVRASLGLGTLDSGDDDTGPTEVVATGPLGRLLDQVHAAAVAPCPTPGAFRGQLRPYQERGVGWLAFLGQLGLGACLADDMGLGKTAQLIATLLADPRPEPTLVVCPVSVLGNWARELARFAPDLRVQVHHGTDRFDGNPERFAEIVAERDVVLSTYSLVARDAEHLHGIPWGRVVLDEAQQIKNPRTATARAVRTLRSDRRVALTGTPVENRLSELWSIMQFLNPGLLGTITSFTERFAGPIEREADERATTALQQRVAPFMLRRLKTDRTIIDDLPDKIEQTERCVLSREQATLYQAVVDGLLALAESEEGIARSGAVLAGIARLKQVCNHPAHYLGDGSALAARSGKLVRVEELLDEIVDVGDKVLCFTQFTDWGDRLVAHLADRYGREPLWLHGGVPRRARERMMDAFAEPDGPQIFLLSLKAGGTGLNLTAASHVIHVDRWWNPAVEDQATDRAYRIGQSRTVQVHKMVCTGTIEERIDEMITSKRELAERVVGSGEQWITKLDTATLRDVVSLRDSEVS